jgi:hypothetical protein
VAVLIVNDHFLKAHYPGLVTGKLSDVAGLAFFPLFLQALWELGSDALGRSWRPSWRVLATSIALTGVAFTLVKLWPPATEAYRFGWGILQWPVIALLRVLRGSELPALQSVALVRDPTDLLALPALAIAAWIGSRRVEYRPGP